MAAVIVLELNMLEAIEKISYLFEKTIEMLSGYAIFI